MNESNIQKRVIYRGGAGIEFSLCGFHAGRDLFHVYVSLGVVTLYLTSTPLHNFLHRMKAGRDALRQGNRK